MIDPANFGTGTLFHAAEAERQMWIGNGTFVGAAGDEDARLSACFSFSAQ